MIAWLEERLIFAPSRYPEGHWNPDDFAFEDVWFTTSDSVLLHGWYCPCPAEIPSVIGGLSRPVILYFHGNAGNLSGRAENIGLWQRQLGVDVFIFDYRGYGRSRGRPYEMGLYIDSRAAYRWLTQRRSVDPDRIIFLGRSLGAAVALELGVEVPHRGAILSSAFTSVPEIAAHMYPWLPVRRLLRTQFSNRERIAAYRKPILLIHGAADDLVPLSHMVELFELANSPKQKLAIAAAGHNDVDATGGEELFKAIASFLNEIMR